MLLERKLGKLSLVVLLIFMALFASLGLLNTINPLEDQLLDGGLYGGGSYNV